MTQQTLTGAAQRSATAVQEVATATADGHPLTVVPVADFTRPGGTATLPQGPYQVPVVLSDGTICIVDDVVHNHHKRPVTLVMFVIGNLELANPTPVDMDGLQLEKVGRSLVRWRLAFRWKAEIALAPGCDRCGTFPGHPCHDDHMPV